MHESEHSARSVAGPFVKPVPAEGAHPARAAGTPLPAMHPPPFLPSRRTPILTQPVPSPAEPTEAAPPEPGMAPDEFGVGQMPEPVEPEPSAPEAATPPPTPESPTTVDWVDAMPVAAEEPDRQAGQEPESEAATPVAAPGPDATSADVEPARSLEEDAARLLRTLADRIDARELRLPPLGDVRGDAALLTVVLAALLAPQGPGPDDAAAGPVGGASSPSAH